MADLILNTNDDISLGAGSTVVDVFGTDGAETLSFALGAEAVLDASFNRGLATLDFAGPAADYTASLSGSSLVLTDINGGSITIPVGTAGATLTFADGARTLVYNTTTDQVDLGGQVITTTPVAVTPGSTPAPTPTYEISPSTSSVGEGHSVTFTLATTDVAAGTTLAYTVSGTNDAASLDGSGTFVTDSSGHASVTLTVPTNATTGDSGSLTLSLLNGDASSTVSTVDTTGTPTTAPQTYTLTSGIDHFTAAAGSTGNTFVATDAGGAPTLTNLDSLTGGAGDTLNVGYTSNEINTTLLPGLTVSGIGTANLSTTVQSSANDYAITADTNSWSGLTTLNLAAGSSNNHGGAIDVSAAQTTDVNAASSSGKVTINGGQNVSVNAIDADVEIGNWTTVITPGDPTDPTAAVVVADSQVDGSSVEVDGGTNVYVTTTGGTGGNGITIGTSDTGHHGGNQQATPTGDVYVQATQASGHQGATVVNGGAIDSVTETAANTTPQTSVALGDVTVNGTTGASESTAQTDGTFSTVPTTEVTINQTPESSSDPRVSDGRDAVVDGNYGTNTLGTITEVNLNGIERWNYIADSNLQDLSVSNAAAGSVVGIYDDSGITSAANLNLTVDNDVETALYEVSGAGNPGYTSATINTTGDASSISRLDLPDVANLTIQGNAALTIDSFHLQNDVTGVQINATGQTAALTIWEPLSAIQGFTGGANSGDENIGISGATTQTIQMGGADNVVRLHTGELGIGGSITGGTVFDSSSYNTLVMDGNSFFDYGAGNAEQLSSAPAAIADFQQLDIGETYGANPVTINLANLGNINFVQSEGTNGNAGTPSVQVDTWTAPSLTAGQSITIDGVTVTAYANANSTDVAAAVLAQLTNPTLPENIPGIATVSLDTGSSTYNPEYTATQGSQANELVFTYAAPSAGGSYGPEAQVGVTTSYVTAGTVGTPTITDGASYKAGTAEVNFAPTAASLTVGTSITLDGETVTINSTSVTAEALVQAFTAGNTDGGLLSITGTLNSSEFTLSDEGNGKLLATAVSATGTFDSNTADANASFYTSGTGIVAPTVTAVAGTNETAVVTFDALSAGQTVTVNGVTLLATTSASAADVAAAAATVASGGTYSGTEFVVSGTVTDTNWDALPPTQSGSTVTFYNVVNGTDTNFAVSADGGATAAPTDGTFVDTGGNGSAPLVLTGYTSGGTLEFTAGAAVDAPVTIELTTAAIAAGATTFNVQLDGGVSAAAAVNVPNVATLGLELGGIGGTNILNLSEQTASPHQAPLTTLNISDLTGATDGVVIYDSTPGDSAALTTINASGTAGGTDDVSGLAGILSTTAAITFTGGGGHLVADSSTSATGGIETITAGTGGVSFDATTAALGGTLNTTSYTFNLGNTDHSTGGYNALTFADGSAIQSAPAVVTGFTNYTGSLATEDTLSFTSGNQILVNGIYVTGQAGLSDTVNDGVIAFGGIAYSGDTISQLLTAAENIVNSGSGTGNTAAFQYGGATYVVHEGATPNPSNDVVVQLQGTTGITELTNTYDSVHGAHYLVIG